MKKEEEEDMGTTRGGLMDIGTIYQVQKQHNWPQSSEEDENRREKTKVIQCRVEFFGI